MTPKISLVTVLAVALVAVPAAWGGQAPDAFQRAVTAKLASQSLPQPNPRGMIASDSVESARQQAQPFNLRQVLASDSVETAKAAGSAVQPSPSARIRLGRDREAAGSAVQPLAMLASDSVESARAESQPQPPRRSRVRLGRGIRHRTDVG